MKQDGWTKIHIYSNWCYIDKIGDKEITSDMRFDVRLADGTIFEDLRIKVHESSENVSEQGQAHGTDIPVIEGYFAIPLHGQLIKVRATDVEVKRSKQR